MTNSHGHSHAGRERSCNVCGITYQAHRSNSRYCSSRCTKRAQRKAEPNGAGQTAGLKSWLVKRGFIGSVGDKGCGTTVSPDVILATLQVASKGIHERGLRPIAPLTMPALKAALRDMNCAA